MIFVLLASIVAFTQSKRPNILLLFPDQWRFDWADPSNGILNIHTPNFETIVSQGTRFLNAYVASPLCAPSRSCLAAGREYDHTHVPGNGYDFPKNITTFYTVLRSAGYHVMVSGKDDLTKKSGPGEKGDYRANELGFSDWERCAGKGGVKREGKPSEPYGLYLADHVPNGFANYEYCFKNCTDHACFTPCTRLPEHLYEDNWVANRTRMLFKRRPTGSKRKPWFLQVNFPGPHPPFFITKSMNISINNVMFPPAVDNGKDNPMLLGIARQDYVAEIENLDRLFGLILKDLDASGERNETIVCISSDHGEMLGNHDLWGKTHPWEGSAGVPLVCSGLGIIHQTIDVPVGNMDMAATFLDFGQASKPAKMTSMSFRDVLEGKAKKPSRTVVSSGLGHWRSVVQNVNDTSLMKLVCCVATKGKCSGRTFNSPVKNGRQLLLFDISVDPFEMRDIAPSNPSVVTDMKKKLPGGWCH